MEPVFALDVGTRVVMGLLMEKDEKGYRILASAKTEHRQRAMYDGQVHDVGEVARAVHKVKAELEKKSKTKLGKVAVAAAGRALRTELAAAERQEPAPIRWEQSDILALEMEAVQSALQQIDAANRELSVTYHCVGYTTVAAQLDGVEISNLLSQRGRRAAISVIATFLPRTVIDGLSAVLACCELEMTSLTLEPIAAGYAAIPPDMRRLNLALVDIGAGTSDIALTRNGSFFAYGMVPMAGDEITESICAHYLLDFSDGERVKKELAGESGEIHFNDFFGTGIAVPAQEVADIIEPTVRELADKIALEILKLNQGVPQGIILIGGGSQIRQLPEYLSERTGIPRNRIGIQIRERLTQVLGDKGVQGPDAITPIGIGMAGLSGQGLKYYAVLVNNAPISIFELQLATVAEALLAAGIQPRSFIGKPGAALTYEWQGEVRVIPGSLGTPAQLTVNGLPARLDQAVKPGDIVQFTAGTPGQAARASLKQVVPEAEVKTILWNDQPEEFGTQYLIDGIPSSLEQSLTDGCKITWLPNDDLDRLLRQKELTSEFKPIRIFINGQERVLAPRHEIRVNGEVVQGNCPLAAGDSIKVSTAPLTLADLELSSPDLVFQVNGQAMTYPGSKLTVRSGERVLSGHEAIDDGLELWVEREPLVPILSDLLPHLDLNLDTVQGSRLILAVNGHPAEFTTELQQGDQIRIYWE